MRIFAALLVSFLAAGEVWANDPPAKEEPAKEASAKDAAPKEGAHGAANDKKAVKPSANVILDALANQKPLKEKPPTAATRAREEMAESELSAKIAERLAVMRAAQAARVASATRAKKAKAEEAAHPVIHNINHWSYEGETGPAQWGKINTNWAACGAGTRQSPIDIRDGIRVDLEPIAFDYRPSSFSVTDNGHTVQVTLSGGNYITVMNRMYELLQFHFHRPSEERINGRGFEMVVHLVHKDAEGKLAVVAVLIERGKAQNLIQTIWNNLPLEKNDSASPNIVLDMNDLLPSRRDYYTFMGSLTTPPCTEGVLWMVMKEPVQASPDQLALFSRLYPLNARPIQPSSGRIIKETN